MIRTCGEHLLRSYGKNSFIPTYAAFNLIGDADMGGRELLMALTGLNSRGYKNSTLLFNLARVFIARSPARALINPPWKGIAEPMWEPSRSATARPITTLFHRSPVGFHRNRPCEPGADRSIASSNLRDGRFLSDHQPRGSAQPRRPDLQRHHGAGAAAAPALQPFFSQIKQDLGFGIYVPDCDTTACAFSAATQAGSDDPVLEQPLVDFYQGYQVGNRSNEPLVTVPLNDHVDYEGGVATWIDNIGGERPFGNDLDPTLNLDILEVSFRNLARWKIIETPPRLAMLHRIIGFQKRLAASGAFTDPRSHIYYLPELYCAYFGRCYAAFIALPPEARQALDPDGAFNFIRSRVLAYVEGQLIAAEMNTSMPRWR